MAEFLGGALGILDEAEKINKINYRITLYNYLIVLLNTKKTLQRQKVPDNEKLLQHIDEEIHEVINQILLLRKTEQEKE